jgi:hypothetical protein
MCRLYVCLVKSNLRAGQHESKEGQQNMFPDPNHALWNWMGLYKQHASISRPVSSIEATMELNWIKSTAILRWGELMWTEVELSETEGNWGLVSWCGLKLNWVKWREQRGRTSGFRPSFSYTDKNSVEKHVQNSVVCGCGSKMTNKMWEKRQIACQTEIKCQI